MIEIICVPVIVALVFVIMEIYKKFIAKENKILVAIIPIIGGVLGIIFGIICFYAIPSIIPATNILTAILIGCASGLSATGCNQIFKQLKQFGIDVKEPEDKTHDEETKDE
ncbi:MAG TPA: hypothetical protein IAC38_01775 [Candidatus Caccovivens faecavium]|nr:hypothetical protein [Candidatus Caccovivens faecavium]